MFPSPADLRASVDPRAGTPATDMERFFDLFPERQARQRPLHHRRGLARSTARVKREYGGIRKPLIRMQQERARQRGPTCASCPLRQAFVENLVRASLDGVDAMLWPRNA